MKARQIKALAKALRSGEYIQGRMALQRQELDGTQWCCLGVAIDVLCDGDWKPEPVNHALNGLWMFDGEAMMPSTAALREMGMDEVTANELAHDNDDLNMTFDQIADKIEGSLYARLLKETGALELDPDDE